MCILFEVNSLPVVLDSEVVDLRVCLQSADRELAELKSDIKQEKKAHDTRNMELLCRVCVCVCVCVCVSMSVSVNSNQVRDQKEPR